MAYQEISYETEGDVGVITLRRPEARNALTFTTYRELEDGVRSTAARCSDHNRRRPGVLLRR